MTVSVAFTDILVNATNDIIGSAISAGAIFREDIGRYLSSDLIGCGLYRDRVMIAVCRSKATWPGAKEPRTGAGGGDVQRCLLALRGIQLSSFASCFRDVL